MIRRLLVTQGVCVALIRRLVVTQGVSLNTFCCACFAAAVPSNLESRLSPPRRSGKPSSQTTSKNFSKLQLGPHWCDSLIYCPETKFWIINRTGQSITRAHKGAHEGAMQRSEMQKHSRRRRDIRLRQYNSQAAFGGLTWSVSAA